MNGNSIGTIFRITTWGESHGPSLGVIIDGCPAGIPLAATDFVADMARRQGGQNALATPRKESDEVHIESGVFEGFTTGTPLCLRILNKNQNSSDYEKFRDVPRPGHADLTTYLKHGTRDHRGGGRSSARETVARVAAGVVAKKILAAKGIELLAWVSRVGDQSLPATAEKNIEELRQIRDQSALGLVVPDDEAGKIFTLLGSLREKKDSLGGAISCRVDHLPVGLGEPVFDKLGALLAHALFSLPAVVGFEVGGGIAMSEAPGSEIRDPIGIVDDIPQPLGNKHGGLLGGMSSGLPLFLSVAFHAPTSIPQPIQSVDLRTKAETEITVGGRHDAFPLPRAVPMVEAMVAITLADALLRTRD